MNIVHVEDEKPLKDILKTTLATFDPSVNIIQFTTGDDALTYIQKNSESIDLFILDIRLPGTLNGVQLAEKIRQMHCPGHMVITSAFSRPSPETLTTLRCDYYRKPWHLVELMQKLLHYKNKDLPKS
jgi:response regulator of citrate/malate metabolism